jgi:transcription elongation factor Elf1
MTVDVFDCPYCKRGKDSSYSSALIPPEIMNHICDACGGEYLVKLREFYDKMNDIS